MYSTQISYSLIIDPYTDRYNYVKHVKFSLLFGLIKWSDSIRYAYPLFDSKEEGEEFIEQLKLIKC